MDIDMPGYFSIEGEDFGYQYDLLRSFADASGLELEILPGKTLSEIDELLAAGDADMAATLTGHTDGAGYAETVYSTTFSLVTRSADATRARRAGKVYPSELMEDKKVMISSAFRHSPSWDMLLDSVSTSGTYVTSRNAVDLVDALRGGEFDYLVCEKSEAQLITALNRGISRVADFEDAVGISITAADGETAGLFAAWFDGFRESTEYAELNYVYLDKGSAHLLASKTGKGRSHKAISEYDMIMREVCEREGYDWRLLSAIAYNESRFNADVVSSRGARGLMQIMPQTARQFDVDPDEAMVPEVNIMLAAKLLRKIEGMLRFGSNITYNDRMGIVLACYNCGVGHVFDARRLAAKYGGNPDSWNDVAYFLQRKGDPEFLADDAVKCGRFNGSGQTLAFVSDVLTRYDTYCATVAR
ncbi:MAG: transglycosylase SLT domain-containing protein [Alistipes sp.]|nr:transglycosylase SLT domain-containing protein [Alistipes sp.]